MQKQLKIFCEIRTSFVLKQFVGRNLRTIMFYNLCDILYNFGYLLHHSLFVSQKLWAEIQCYYNISI